MKTLRFFILSVAMLFMFGSMLYGQSNDPGQKEYAFFINDSLVKDIRMYPSLRPYNIDEVSMKDTSIVIDGVAYRGMIRIKCSDMSKLISLRQVREEYTDLGPTENAVYMINNSFEKVKSLDDAIVDRDKISKVETLRSDELDYLKGAELKFAVLRIYYIERNDLSSSLAKRLEEAMMRRDK